MARWDDERLGMLQEGIRLCFTRWTALQLAVDNEWGGRDSLKKSQELVEDVVYFLTQTKGTLYIDDLEALLKDAMSDVFNTELEDGSELEVAEVVMYLNGECGAGNYDRVRAMAAEANSKTGSQQKSVCQDPEEEAGDDEDEVREEPSSTTGDEKQELESSSTRNGVDESNPEAMDIDKSNGAVDDEWTVVQNRRRKGGKRTA